MKGKEDYLSFFFKKVMMEFFCMYKFCIVMVNNILIMVKMDLIFLD